MIEKRHITAITSAKTEAEKTAEAAAAMIEKPIYLIRCILQRHEEGVLEVIRELMAEIAALEKDADFYQEQAHRLRGERAILRDSAKDVIAWCDETDSGASLYCIDRLRHAIAVTETPHNTEIDAEIAAAEFAEAERQIQTGGH